MTRSRVSSPRGLSITTAKRDSSWAGASAICVVMQISYRPPMQPGTGPSHSVHPASIPLPTGPMHQDLVPPCRLFFCGALISAAWVHAFAAPREYRWRAVGGADRAGPERNDVNQRARRIFLPTAMVAGAAALILTTAVQAGPG